ncbi:ABC transporter ATP-binding protein [Pararhodospirillum photometricum]|uniref:ABC transporter ATP-binding protein n=1 Tax=Pararhodospirillum photometricum DSM 122 TaxID=1150469 RepID=H6SIZ6_PARPM|nr:ABC transporter ATP-binding protein [Pararhodospirillum photometricum]CCG07961.1 ABC transporter ATP-binding protein [Pararhodospirillum photometricum DSM 122]
MADVVLHVKDVFKSFGGLRALNNVNLAIERGKTHAIIGPNGAGKSTLLNAIIGRLVPDSGSVTFEGDSITGLQPYEINQKGVVRVFQTPEIFPDLSLLQNVMIPVLAKREGSFRFNPFARLFEDKAVREEAMRMLEDVGLQDQSHREAANLSRGDKRRLEMAMGLVQRPRLLLLDEPTAGMSRHDTNRTIDLLQEVKARGLTKVIIEHDMHVVFSLADRITVLAQGTIICEGTPDEVRGNPKVQEAYLGGAHL